MAAQINAITAIPWVIFWIYWFAAIIYDAVSGKMKKAVRGQPFIAGRVQSLTLVVAIILVIANFPQKYYPLGVRFLPNSPAVLYTGLALSLLGIAFAIWAREHLGGNWSATVQLKKGHTLVMSGPYRIVRHPIYSGITLGIIGSAISIGNVAGIIAIICMAIFSLTRIADEEKLMHQAFGKEYEKYSGHVRAYIPGLW
jgi:protein-S-isoprenylcysteine O-methyltransferase Ste14